MGDASQMSEMSGMSSASSTSSVHDDGASSNKKVYIYGGVVLLLVLAIAAVLFGNKVLREGEGPGGAGGGGGGKEKTEDIDYPPIPSAPSAPPPAASAPTTLTTSITTTTTLKPALPVKLLVCSATSKPYPDDGICDFMLHRTETATGPLADPLVAAISGFASVATAMKKTQCGLEITETSISDTITQLGTTSGSTAMTKLWPQNVRSYAFFDADLSVKTTDTYVNQIINLLKEIYKLQASIMRKGGAVPTVFGFLFLGAAPLYMNSTDPSNIVKTTLERMISETKPDAVLFRTSYLRSYDNAPPTCRSTGPSIWNQATVPDQPTFVESLQLRRDVALPGNTSQMLSLMLTGRFVTYGSSLSTASVELGSSLVCVESGTWNGWPSLACPGGPQYKLHEQSKHYDPVRITHFGQTSLKSLTAYDDKDDIKKKMCKSKVEHGFDGGWVVFDVSADDTNKYCNDMKYTDQFPFLHYVREYMDQDFKTCP